MKIPFYNQLSNLRVQIAILSLVGWAIGLSIDRTYVESYREESDSIFRGIGKMDMVRTRGQNAALIILSIFETGLFGLGLGFFVAVGFRVFKIKNSMLRKRMVWCWATISFFMCEWWPHSTTHFLILTTGKSPIENYITMEATFHWTITFCSACLGYFQYDLIKLMYEVAMMRLKMKEGREVDPLKQEWYKNFNYHAIGVGLAIFVIAVPVAFHYQPLTPELVTYQRFFYVTFHLVNSAVVAIGFAFAYVACRTILLLPPSPGKRVSIISSIAIAFLFIIQYPHPFVHVNGNAKLTMDNTVAIDFGVHIPIVFATGILAFYQFRMLELATDEKSSLSVAAQMRRKSQTNNSRESGGTSMKSMDANAQSGSFGTSSIEDSLSKNTSSNENNNQNNNQDASDNTTVVVDMKTYGDDNVTIDIKG